MKVYTLSWAGYDDDFIRNGIYGVYSNKRCAALAADLITDEYGYTILDWDNDRTTERYFTDHGTWIIERFTLDD